MRKKYRMRDWIIAFFGTWIMVFVMYGLYYFFIGILVGLEVDANTFDTIGVAGMLFTPFIGLIFAYFLLVYRRGVERKQGFWTAVGSMILLISACFGIVFLLLSTLGH